MITLTVNNRKVKGEEPTTVLALCQKLGIDIPTLCYYKALRPYGGCRLCLVEIGRNGSFSLMASCTQPAEEGMVVKTDTQKVFQARQTIIRLLLLSAPKAERIKELARQYQVKEDRFGPEDTNCILCGLCTRTCSELMGVNAIGFINRGAKKEVVTPFKEYSQVCTRCGACNFLCPTGKIKLKEITDKEVVPNLSKFNLELTSRANIYLPYPQAVPNVPFIDKENCPYLLREKCGACQKFCDANAIDYKQEDTLLDKEVGAIVVESGFDLFDAGKCGEYGYGRYPNVITSLQFERLLSSSGPTEGEILRPSDGKLPHRIAFIQCVGSRDIHSGNEYCSNVCCMYSTKEAIIAKEHHEEIEASIFFIDIRAFGKDFDKYYESAKERYGVRYVRSQVSKVYQLQQTKNLVLRYVAEDESIKEEEFDLVVLAVGMVPAAGTKGLKESLGIESDQYGFAKTKNFSLTETSRPGVFAAGTFTEPKDIPETVVSASSAGADASELLGNSRWALTRRKEYPPERDVSEEELRVGVIVCRCGRNIASVVDVPSVAEFAKGLPDVVYADEFIYSCSQDSLVKIKEKIKEHRLNRVVVASCTPRTHDPLFRDTIREAGLNPCLFDMASIREHCSWVHMERPKEATRKAKALVAMAVSKVRLLYPVKSRYFEVTKKALVIGGGISGMSAALSVARQGFKVYLVEREAELGGHLSEIYFTLDGGRPQELLKEIIEEVKNNPLIKIYCKAKVKNLSGYVGNFKTTITAEEGEVELVHGAVIVATGAKEYQPTDYLYGKDSRVLLQSEFEKRLYKKDPATLGANSLVVIQCVESREEKRPYCSRICCSTAIKNAIRLKELNPDTDLFILYRDIRSYGLMERYYKEAREKGIIFIRYEKEAKPSVELKDAKLIVSLTDPVMGEVITLNPDILILSSGMRPRENDELSKRLKLPLNEEGFFLEAHAKIRPLDFTTEGIFLCGTAHSPRHIPEAVTQARGSAMRAVTILAKDQLEGKSEIVFVREQLCRGCGVCITVCPYEAREIDEETKTARVLEAVCQGCGACAVACPSGATKHLMFEKPQVMAMVEEAIDR